MKLSSGKGGKVVGRHLLRVVKDHGVSFKGLPTDGRKTDQKYGYAKVGDLAVEAVWRKSRKRIGISYLSGDCIQVMSYDETIPFVLNADSYFEPASGKLIELPEDRAYTDRNDPETIAAQKSFHEKALEAFMGAKYGDCVIAGFRYRPIAPVDKVINGIKYLWGYEIEDASARQMAEVDIFGSIHGRINGKKGGAAIHIQAPSRKQDIAATPFQIELVLSALGAQP